MGQPERIVTRQIDYVAILRSDASALATAARTGPLDAPVAACPGWDLARLVSHVGSVHRWATVAITTGKEPDRASLERPPRDPAVVVDWFGAGVEPLAAALSALDDDAPVWNFSNAPPVGRFWPRRQAQETAMHRWDAQRAVGAPDPIHPELAVDGIDELLDVWAPLVLEGRDGIDIGGSVYLQVTDATEAERWTLRTDDGLFSVGRGQASGDVTVEGSASDLLLLLWRRVPADDPALTVSGERAVLDRWLELGVP